ncbi:MAG: hypothetical protein ACXWUP_03535 [Allosphingosinicella sp.]
MNKLYILAGAAVMATAGAALAQTGTPATPTSMRPERNVDVTREQVIERTDQCFARLDLNNDGRATAEEARQGAQQRHAEHAGQMFDRMDLDHDGSVTRAEFDQARTQMHAQRGERGARGGRGGMRGAHHRQGMRGGHGGRGEGMFGEQGFITREQMRERALTRFDRLDANRDGTLTVAERQQGREQFRQERRERREQAQ